MNPFKHKQLEEFTIADCELYISRYPYGEYALEVKRLLRELKKRKAVQPQVVNEEAIQQTERAREVKTEKPRLSKNALKYTKQTKTTSQSEDDTKIIFAWIGIVVVSLVIGTIIFLVLDEILPNDWKKYRVAIYPALMTIGRWIQEKME